MSNLRKDILISVFDPDIEKPTCVEAWYQAAREGGGFYAVLVDEPQASRFFTIGQLCEAPERVWRELTPANVIRLRPRV
jgi:hypothetical protein